MGFKGLHMGVTVTEVVQRTDAAFLVLTGDAQRTLGVTATCASCGSTTMKVGVPPEMAALVHPGDASVLCGGPGSDETLQKVDPHEPIFVLRARDSVAAQTVLQWVHAVATAAGIFPNGNAVVVEAEALDHALSLVEQTAQVAKLRQAIVWAGMMAAWPTHQLPD